MRMRHYQWLQLHCLSDSRRLALASTTATLASTTSSRDPTPKIDPQSFARPNNYYAIFNFSYKKKKKNISLLYLLDWSFDLGVTRGHRWRRSQTGSALVFELNRLEPKWPTRPSCWARPRMGIRQRAADWKGAHLRPCDSLFEIARICWRERSMILQYF